MCLPVSMLPKLGYHPLLYRVEGMHLMVNTCPIGESELFAMKPMKLELQYDGIGAYVCIVVIHYV